MTRAISLPYYRQDVGGSDFESLLDGAVKRDSSLGSIADGIAQDLNFNFYAGQDMIRIVRALLPEVREQLIERVVDWEPKGSRATRRWFDLHERMAFLLSDYELLGCLVDDPWFAWLNNTRQPLTSSVVRSLSGDWVVENYLFGVLLATSVRQSDLARSEAVAFANAGFIALGAGDEGLKRTLMVATESLLSGRSGRQLSREFAAGGGNEISHFEALAFLLES